MDNHNMKDPLTVVINATIIATIKTLNGQLEGFRRTILAMKVDPSKSEYINGYLQCLHDIQDALDHAAEAARKP